MRKLVSLMKKLIPFLKSQDQEILETNYKIKTHFNLKSIPSITQFTELKELIGGIKDAKTEILEKWINSDNADNPKYKLKLTNAKFDKSSGKIIYVEFEEER